ncbi:hypothetical protein JW823_08640 [bacterium]|nr:hypothetical protein [candidate division CSSED10-310 bacterium]
MDKLNRFGILIAVFVFFLLVLCFNGYSTDDAFISFRFAGNLASGHGLVYNVDQAPVEGYTNFLWTILIACFAFVKMPMPESAAFLSTFFSVALLLLMGVWAYRQREFTSHFSVATPILMMASFPALALWSTTGMETAFFTFLLVTGTVFISVEERREWIGILSGLTFAFAALTRPEGLLLGGLIIVLSFIEARDWGMRMLSFFIRLIIFLLPPVLHAIWRKSYYGHWVPNTFYAKTTASHQLYQSGLEYLKDFLIQGGIILVILTFLALFIRPKVEGLWTILITSTVYMAYVVWVGGDWMPANRLFLPILPFLIMGASVFVVKSKDVSPRFLLVLLLLICIYFLYSGINSQAPFMRHSLLAQTILNDDPPVDVLKELGLHLRETASPYDLLAVVPAGKVPYYSGLRTIDMRGLCDTHIARQPIPADLKHRLPGHLKRDPEYVLSKQPNYIVLSGAISKENRKLADLTERGSDPVLDEWSILKMPEFIENYREVRVPMSMGDKDLLYYKRIDKNNRVEPLLKFPDDASENQYNERVSPIEPDLPQQP